MRAYSPGVTKPDDITQALPKDLPVLAVLGLSDTGEGDWARLRGLQYSSLAQNTLARLFSHGIAALATAALVVGKVHFLAILGWLAALGAALYYASRFDSTLIDTDRRHITRDEVNRQNQGAILTALAWVPLSWQCKTWC